MTNLLHTLKQIAPLSDEDCQRLMDMTKTIHLKKGDYWIEAGKKNTLVAFLDEGYLRKFYVKDGNEITDFFYFENDISADLPSILGNSLPLASIVAMKKTSVTAFSYYDFNDLCRSTPSFEYLHRLIVQQTFLRFYNRTMSFIVQSPKERYEELLVSNPRILQHATQYHIASYLGISPQHLSRLKSES